ncbi:substrate-binding domain-containing protein [Paenibacillus sp. KN14-4R]|uniref:substrate-binding domain-containing protein n=1 Tax=Paenibacillus sp. KN14-4R TaxID=3445773 RepID=UPI003FA0B521
MNRKRLGLLLFIWLCVAASISSCSNQAIERDRGQRKEIAFVAKLKQGDYWNTVRMGAETAAKELGINLNYMAPDLEEDVSRLNDLVLQSIRSHVDAVVVAPHDTSSLTDITEQAGKKHIPVITIDSEVGTPSVQSMIGTNNYEAGKKAGEKLIELTGKSARIALMSIMQDSHQADLREQGFLDAIKQHPQVQLVDTLFCLSDQRYANKLTLDTIENNGPINGFVALNTAASLGVADGVKQLGLAGKVKIVAFDNTPTELELLQAGVFQATIVQNPFSIGYLSVKYAVEAARNKKVPQRVDTGFKVIDNENMFWSENQKLLFPFVK